MAWPFSDISYSIKCWVCHRKINLKVNFHSVTCGILWHLALIQNSQSTVKHSTLEKFMRNPSTSEPINKRRQSAKIRNINSENFQGKWQWSIYFGLNKLLAAQYYMIKLILNYLCHKFVIKSVVLFNKNEIPHYHSNTVFTPRPRPDSPGRWRHESELRG